jgi:hypothetical protein
VNRSSSPELKLLAQQMIESLENKNPQNASTATDNTAGTASRSYTTNDNAIHLFVMVADMKKVNTTAAKLKISDYNQKYNSLEKLSTTSIYLDDKFQIITVSNFPDKEKAMDYYNGIVKSEYVFATLQKDGFQVFVISVDNYPILYKTKDLKNYTEFFKDNYL